MEDIIPEFNNSNDIFDFLFRNMKDREDLSQLKVKSRMYSTSPYFLEHKSVFNQTTDTLHSQIVDILCENQGKISCITSSGIKTFSYDQSYTNLILENEALHICSFKDYIGVTVLEKPIFKIYKNGDLLLKEELNDVYDFNHIKMFDSPYQDQMGIVLARNNNSILYYSFKEEKINLEQTISTGNYWGMNVIAMSNDNKLMAIGCDDLYTLVFSLDRSEGFQLKKDYKGGGYGACFNSNSTLLVCSNKRSIVVYDLITHSCVFTTMVNSYLVPKFSPVIPDMLLIWDHNGLAVNSIHKKKTCIITQEHTIQNYRVFRFDTFSLCFSKDGKKVFCGNNEFILEFNVINMNILGNLYQNLERENFSDVIIKTPE